MYVLYCNYVTQKIRIISCQPMTIIDLQCVVQKIMYLTFQERNYWYMLLFVVFVQHNRYRMHTFKVNTFVCSHTIPLHGQYDRFVLCIVNLECVSLLYFAL